MADSFRLVSCADGLLLLIAIEPNGFRLVSYRTVESRIGTMTRNKPTLPASETFATRRFATDDLLADALRIELAA